MVFALAAGTAHTDADVDAAHFVGSIGVGFALTRLNRLGGTSGTQRRVGRRQRLHAPATRIFTGLTHGLGGLDGTNNRAADGKWPKFGIKFCSVRCI